MKSQGCALAAAGLLVFIFTSCATVAPPADKPAPVASSEQPAVQEPPAPTPAPVEPTAPQEPSATAKPVPPKPAATSAPAPAAEPSQPIEVSKEVYAKTFSEVEKVIKDLNTIISNQEYDAWVSYLTPEYRRQMSSPANLNELSSMPLLKRNNIVLSSLQDYFTWVVVPSRSHVRLDDLVFLNENTVDAIMHVRGQSVILYRLEKRNGAWKIGLL